MPSFLVPPLAFGISTCFAGGGEHDPDGHPVPQLVQISRKVLLEHGDRFIIHASSSAIGPHQLVRFPHDPLRNAVRFSLIPAVQVADLRQQDNAASSLHLHYKGFNTTASNSAPRRH